MNKAYFMFGCCKDRHDASILWFIILRGYNSTGGKGEARPKVAASP